MTAGAAEDEVRAELLELVQAKEEDVIMLDVLRAAEEDGDDEMEELDKSPEHSAARGLVCVITRLSTAISMVDADEYATMLLLAVRISKDTNDTFQYVRSSAIRLRRRQIYEK